MGVTNKSITIRRRKRQRKTESFTRIDKQRQDFTDLPGQLTFKINQYVKNKLLINDD